MTLFLAGLVSFFRKGLSGVVADIVGGIGIPAAVLLLLIRSNVGLRHVFQSPMNMMLVLLSVLSRRLSMNFSKFLMSFLFSWPLFG